METSRGRRRGGDVDLPVETNRVDGNADLPLETGRGGAAAATWISASGDESRRRGYSAETGARLRYIWIEAGWVYSGGHTCTCDLNRNTGPTQYGACWGSDGPGTATCATQRADCEEGEVWLEPKDALALHGFECHCEDVLVGACESAARGVACAVDADSCGGDGAWVSAREIADAGHICRLCGLDATLEPTRAPNAPSDKKDGADVANAGVLIIIVVGVVLVAAIIGGAAVVIARTKAGAGRPITPVATVEGVEMASSVVVVPSDAELKAGV